MNAVHAVVAVKGLQRGKHRLAGVLSDAERHRLITTMLRTVLDTLSATPGISHVSVLTRDRSLLPTLLPTLLIEGIDHLDDPGFGLNPAIAHAACVLSQSGARSMLVLPADLPFVTPDDLGALLAAAEHHDAVIAPDTLRSGTNALLLSPPDLILPRFGISSFAVHVAAIRDAGVEPYILERAGLAQDIDVPADLFALANKASGRYSFLEAALAEAT